MARKGVLLISTLFILAVSVLFSPKALAATTMSGERIAGNDRYDTSIKISNAGWPNGSYYAVLATGEDFPDALSASTLAKHFNSPILLTASKMLTPSVETELGRLKTKYVYVVGGQKAVSQAVLDRLTALGIQYKRISGINRYATSAAVANEIGSASQAVVATGDDYPDALSVASWAACNGAPILLTQAKSMDPDVLAYIKKNSISKFYIVGGVKAVDTTVENSLNNAERIQGGDRFATNLAVLNKFGSQFDYTDLYIATGLDYPDALSGSALCALKNSPIILTSTAPLTSTKDYVSSNISKISNVYIIGGEKAVSDTTLAGTIPPVIMGIDIALSQTSVGLHKQIKATANVNMMPKNAQKPAISFSSGDSSVAAISSDGTITGIKPGTVSINAAAGGKTSSVNIKVILDKKIVLDPGHGGNSSGASTPDSGVYEKDLNWRLTQKVYARLAALGANVLLTRGEDTNPGLDERTQLANSGNADLFISIHHNAAGSTAQGTETYYSTYRPFIDTDGVYVHAYSSGPVYSTDGKLLGYLTSGKDYPFVKEDYQHVYINYNGSVGTVSIYDTSPMDSTPGDVALKSKELASLIDKNIASLGLTDRGAKDDNLAVTRWTNMPSVLIEVGFLSNPTEYAKISTDSFQEQAADEIVQAILQFYQNN